MSDPTIIDAEAVEIGTDVVVAPATNLFASEPVEALHKAQEVASALTGVLRGGGMIQNIQGKDYVKVEGWQTLGSMLGVSAVVTGTRELENGFEATCEARTMDGRVIGRADARCTRDESMWSKRDPYALQGMAQTRATSRALRGPLGHVVKLAGFEATAAEEIPHDGSQPMGGSAAPAESEFQENVLPEGMRWAGSVHGAEWKTIKSTGRSKLLVTIRVPSLKGAKDAIETIWIDPLREEFTQVCEAVGDGGLVEVGADVSAWVGRPIDFIVTINGQYRNHELLPGTVA